VGPIVFLASRIEAGQSSINVSEDSRPHHITGVGAWAFRVDGHQSFSNAQLPALFWVSLLSCPFSYLYSFELCAHCRQSCPGLVVFKTFCICCTNHVELFPATSSCGFDYLRSAGSSERAIAWWASGQSVYRLNLPGLVVCIRSRPWSWLVQEQLMPYTNLKQDALRAQIRGGESSADSGAGRQWLASTETNRLYRTSLMSQREVLRDPVI